MKKKKIKIETIPDRPILYMGDLDGMSEGMKFYKRIGNIFLYISSDGIVAKINNREVGYILKQGDKETDLAVVQEYQHRGIGKILYMEFLRKFPYMIYRTGGLTKSGLKTLKSALRGLNLQNLYIL